MAWQINNSEFNFQDFFLRIEPNMKNYSIGENGASIHSFTSQ